MLVKVFAKIFYVLRQNYYKILFIINYRKLLNFRKEAKEKIFLDLSWENPVYLISSICLVNSLNLKKKMKIFSLDVNNTNSFFYRTLFSMDKNNFLKVNIKNSKIKIKKIPCKDNIKDSILKKYKIPSIKLLPQKSKKKILDYEYNLWLKLYHFYYNLFKKQKIKYAIVSHLNNSNSLSLCKALLDNNVKVFYLRNFDKHTRIRRINKFDEILKISNFDTPSLQDIKKIHKKKYSRIIDLFEKNKNNILSRNYSHYKNFPNFDVRKNYNFKKNFFKIYSNFKIENFSVIIFMANFLDFPNSLGKTWYKDYYNFLKITLSEIKKIKNINWFIKIHPNDKKFGEVSKFFFNNLYLPSHINIWKEEFSNKEILNFIDCLITPRGTSGLEFMSFGMRVLNAERAEYNNNILNNFCISKKEYLKKLNNIQNIDRVSSKQKEISKILLTLSRESNISVKGLNNLPYSNKGLDAYREASTFINFNKKKYDEEIKIMRSWHKSKVKKFNVFKNIYY